MAAHPFADRLPAYIGPCFMFSTGKTFANTRPGRAAAALLLLVIAKEAIPIAVVLEEAEILMRSWSWDQAHIQTQLERMCDLRHYGMEEITANDQGSKAPTSSVNAKRQLRNNVD